MAEVRGAASFDGKLYNASIEPTLHSSSPFLSTYLTLSTLQVLSTWDWHGTRYFESFDNVVALLCFTLLCFTLLYFALLCFTLSYFTLLCFALLCFRFDSV